MVVEKFVKTKKLEMAYEVTGPEDGKPVILIHGWPDCPRTWDEVTPHLHNRGYRTYVTTLRGFGNTKFLQSDARRTGGPFAIASDVKEFIEGLNLAPVDIIGQGWGALAAMTLSSLYGTELVKSEVALSEGWQLFDKLSLEQVKDYWYQWYMTTPQGGEYVRKRQSEFALFMWKQWSPDYQLTAQRSQVLTSYFQNDDWAEVTLDTYRQRWGYNPFDEDYADMKAKLDLLKDISVPTLNIIGKEDYCTDYKMTSSMKNYFKSTFEQQYWDDCGHFIQREQPRNIALAADDWFKKN
ncbi:alpha/beta fold hydrolase [Companilactobacillus mishanensis]|uniref:Alpha/beta hydrolase n=1 Tax=Companilactobacillus mishanensis TaxID=2486008 RepID=A0ABW9P711_9LACO|nr:alpha/beta hydrolase [Companilactobacillus mishanensis]MQS45033.1 alpha/beta hydrolase [Companilactobacillus mishanensis]